MADLWVPNIRHMDVTNGGTTRCWSEEYAIRPALAVVHHFMQGFQNYIGKPGSGSKASAHFSISQLDRDGNQELWQNVSLTRCAWTNGSMRNPIWALASEVPTHYSSRKKRNIQDANRCTITCEAAGFCRAPGTYNKERWLAADPKRYFTYGPHGTLDRLGKKMQDFPDHLIAAQIECTKAAFDLGMIRDDPGPNTITGHYALDQVNRPEDPSQYWVDRWLPVIITAVRPNQATLPDARRISRTPAGITGSLFFGGFSGARQRVRTRSEVRRTQPVSSRSRASRGQSLTARVATLELRVGELEDAIDD